ncbi:putative IFN-alpha/beta binding protein [Lumpy skin disease virus]|uniref:Soluble interferon alpha/beta receptor OPG204 n=1 Tax=Lumpy skin disease virus TaxID=59509 RepID=A0A1C9HHZ8_LSDV|nr:putative IFN-alpha/beta binding protein [Lumpy skin disease virus]AOO78696.1 putative IFN-alpha/beta binding protein [Lumpy skin disease virus]AOO78854.1 putative IFN-alpha/beta binding protein [Lumpy skin disease virus]AOO79013.1 putative IFN-alpha/beta binding protein [Lumpy skin disease virus]AVR51573.1 putative IFN-alpha/beta binding protein [Lumpy skin disease virus]
MLLLTSFVFSLLFSHSSGKRNLSYFDTDEYKNSIKDVYDFSKRLLDDDVLFALNDNCTFRDERGKLATLKEPLSLKCPLLNEYGLKWPYMEKDDYEIKWEVVRNYTKKSINNNTNNYLIEDGKLLILKTNLNTLNSKYLCTITRKRDNDCDQSIVQLSRYRNKNCYKLNGLKGRNIVIECGVRHVEYDTVEWYKQNKTSIIKLNNDSKRRIILRNITKGDSGKYYCKGHYSKLNISYTISRCTYLSVFPLSHYEYELVYMPTIINVTIGEPMTVNCSVRTKANAYEYIGAMWLDDKKLYVGMEENLYQDGSRKIEGDDIIKTSHLVFVNVMEKDIGRTFTCEVGSYFKGEYRTVTLNLKS